MTRKPDGYPLPWCDTLDMPYYKINLIFCARLLGWSKRQSGKEMATIIPWIDEIVARGVVLKSDTAAELD